MQQWARLETVLFVQPFAELFTSLVCFACNIYFACRFGRLSTFGSNLRLVLVFSHIFTALMTLLHPILRLIPEEWYAISNGQYGRASLVYSLFFLLHLLTLLMDSKFLIIGLERRVACEQRDKYEHQAGQEAGRIIGNVTLVMVCCLLLKMLVIQHVYPTRALDLNLHEALNIDKTIHSIVAVNLVALCAWIYGVYEVTRLKQLAEDIKHTGQTLSEAYEVRQLAMICEVIQPLIIAYAWLLVISVSVSSVTIYYHLVEGQPFDRGICQALVNIVYCTVGVYSIFSTLYLIWFMPALKAALARDLLRTFGWRILTPNDVSPSTLSKNLECEEHFEYLRMMWA